MSSIHDARTGAGVVTPLAPAVARTLRIWDALDLELGDFVVVTGDDVRGRLAAVVAAAYGAQPVVLIGRTEAVGALNGVERLAVGDPSSATLALAARMRERPAAAAVELTGSADFTHLLLEALPMFGRAMFAGTEPERLTIDFYTNVHRKGLRLHSAVFDPLAPAGSADPDADLLARAARLLASSQFDADCRAALGAGQHDGR